MLKKGSSKKEKEQSKKALKDKEKNKSNSELKNSDTVDPQNPDDGDEVLVGRSDISLLQKYGILTGDTELIWSFLKSDPRDMSILDQHFGKPSSRKQLIDANGEPGKAKGRRGKLKNTRFDPTLWDPAILNKHIDGTIQLKIIGATNLANTDTVGVSDPYCVIRSTFSTLIHGKTKVIKNSLNPRWDQTFTFEVKQRNAMGDFHINLFDHDLIGKETKQKKKDEKAAQILVEIKYIPNQKPKKEKSAVPVELIKGSLTTITTEQDFAQDYEFIKVLGTGATAEVKLAKVVKADPEKNVAIKIVDKNSEMWEDEVTAEKFQREVEIMGLVRTCVNLVASVDLRETDQFVYIVMELAEFELFDYIMSQEEQHCTEEFTAKIMHSVLKGLEFLHDNYICHRDMKPENVLLSFGNKSSPFPTNVKVSDYGESIMFTEKKANMSGFVGTPPYMAPEIVDDSVSKYTKAVDLWACGIMAHATLVGYLPYDGDNDAETYQLILEADLQFPSPEWEGADPLAMAFISGCLTYEAKKRLDVKSALKSPWIMKHNK